MAMVGLYRGILPSPPAIDFTSSEGKQLFVEAVQNRTMEGFYKLISNFQTQSELTYCGLASLSMALNALSIDPGRKWKGPWRWYDESMLDYCECEPLEKVKARGISLGKLASLAHCAGAHVQAFRTNQTTIHDFRKYLLRCSTFDDCHIILSYHRVGLKQTGAGHYSPVGGYHIGRDMVLILDVARFKYPPHWVPLKLLWEAMERVIEATGQYRGFFFLSKPQYNTMAMVGFYRRILPSPPAIDFTSSEGKQLFVEAVQNRTMEGFYKLISNFQTQSELTYCGLASLSMALNALSIDPGRKWKGPWRWFDESMLDYCECEPLEKVKARGISLGKLASLADCAGAQVEAFRTNQTTIHDFRKYLLRCSTSDDCHIILSYHRTGLKQTGAGHYSPVGGYHIGRDMVLILDVARFKYPPHWVPLKLIWEAMERVIEATGQHRGFMLLSKH